MWDWLRYGSWAAGAWILNNQRRDSIHEYIQSEDLKQLIKDFVLVYGQLPQFPLMQWSEDGHELEVFYPAAIENPVRHYTLFSAPWAPVDCASQANFKNDLSVFVGKISNRAGRPKKPRAWGRTDPGAPVMVVTEKGAKETFLNRITAKDVTGSGFRVFIDDKQRRYIPYGDPMRWLLQRYRDHIKPPQLDWYTANTRETREDLASEESSVHIDLMREGDLERRRHSDFNLPRVSCSTDSVEERGNVEMSCLSS